VNTELEGMWKEAPTALFNVLSWHLPGGAHDYYKTHESKQSVSWPKFEPGNS